MAGIQFSPFDEISLIFSRNTTCLPNCVQNCTHNGTHLWEDVSQAEYTYGPPVASTSNILEFQTVTRISLLLAAVAIGIWWHLQKDRHFFFLPGPWGIWPFGVAYKLWNVKESHAVFMSWSLNYKPFYACRLGPHKFAFFTSASATQKLLSSSEREYMNKGHAYKAIEPFAKTGLLTSDFAKWQERRRILSRAFTAQSLMGYMEVFNKESKSLVSAIEDCGYVQDADVDVNPSTVSLPQGAPIEKLVWQHTLRVVCETTMGTDIWAMEGADQLLDSLDNGKKTSMMRFMQPWLLINWIWKWHPQYNLYHNAVQMVEAFTANVIEKRKDCYARSRTTQEAASADEELNTGIKPRFKSLIEEMLTAGIDEDGMKEEVNTFVVAGFETTALTLQYMLFCLALNPNHQERCREEVDRVFEDETLCPDNEISYDALAHLKYVEKCLMETLRLYPAAPLYFRQLEKPLKIDDNYELPAGVNAGVYLLGLHRNPDYFPNPDVFDPDHFLPERVKSRGQYVHLPFSAGKRSCIGFKVAINEIVVMVSRILRHFVVQTSDTVDSVKLLPTVTLSPERGYNFIFTRRNM